MKKRSLLPRITEDQIHRDVMDYLRLARPRALYFHVPNGARRSKAQSGVLKAMGMLAGTPDLVFVCEGGRVNFIELKAPDGRMAATQIAFKETVEGLGAGYAICRSVGDVADTIKEWGLA